MTHTGFTSDTLVLTSEGHKRIDSLTPTPFLAWNGSEFVVATASKVAEQERVVRLVVTTGAEVECSLEYVFRTQNKSFIQSRRNVALLDLNTEDRLIKAPTPIIEYGTKEFPYAYTHGFYTGAEKFYFRDLVLAKSAVFGMRRPALEYLELDPDKDNKKVLNFPVDMPERFELPLDSGYSLETRLMWLAGLFDSGLIKRKVGDRPIWNIYSDNKDFLWQLKLLMQTIGGNPKVIENEDLNRAHFTMRLNNRPVQTLRELGIPMKNHTFPEIKYTKRGMEFPRMLEVVDDFKKADIYNITLKSGDTAMFNGILAPINHSN